MNSSAHLRMLRNSITCKKTRMSVEKTKRPTRPAHEGADELRVHRESAPPDA